MNLAMAKKVQDGDAVDVSQFPQERFTANPLTSGAFDLTGKYTADEIENGDRDFCHLPTGRWVWSIGLLPNGRILAAFDARFYQRDGVRCLWLR